MYFIYLIYLFEFEHLKLANLVIDLLTERNFWLSGIEKKNVLVIKTFQIENIR